MPILLIKERAVVNFVRNQHLLKYIFFFFFGGSAGGAKSQNIYHISFCIFCTLSNMNYLFTCTNYFIFCLQMGVYGNLEVLLYPAGWVWRFWVCTSSPVGISVEIQRRGYETCFILDSETWCPTHPVPSTISFICVLYHHSPEEKRGSFPSSLHLSTISLFFKSWF